MVAIHRLRVVVGAGVLALTAAVAAQQGPTRALTTADYARAEKFMNYNTTPLVLRSGVQPAWLPDERFWYRITSEKGSEAILIDPVKATRAACDLPDCAQRPAEGGRGGGRGGAAPRTDLPSPDGKRTVFIRDWNLWMRDVASGKETALTSDGVKDFGYATDNAGWTKSDRPIALWSPDS